MIESNAEQLRRTFQEYAEYNRRDLEELRVKTLKKLLVNLKNEAKAVAPTAGEIATKVHSLGWQVTKRGTPDKWGASAMKRIPKNSMRGMKKAERIAEKERRKQAVAAIDEKEKMQAYVIKKRASKIGFMASGYALAARLLNFNVGTVPKMHAKAAASDSQAQTSISVTAGGIEQVDDRTGFVKKAIEATIADMRQYIYSRQQAGRSRFTR